MTDQIKLAEAELCDALSRLNAGMATLDEVDVKIDSLRRLVAEQYQGEIK